MQLFHGVNHFNRGLLVVVFCIFVQACATSPNQSSRTYDDKIPITFYPELGERPALISESEIFQLSEKQQSDFQRYMSHPRNQGTLRHELVSDYLSQFIKGFNYHSDTYVASESADSKTGNCLSLAILTTAFARLANVTVAYELMHTPPVYQRKGNTILSSQHVRSILYQPQAQESEGVLFIFQPVIKIDYFPTSGGHVMRRVPESEFISMYFRNMAAEAIIEQRLADAFWYALESLDYTENNIHATNMLALIYDNLGYQDDAERLYQFGIKYADEKLELLSNYHKFLLRHDRISEAEQIKSQIGQLDDANPFEWLDMADAELASGNLGDALRYYNKVVELAPYLHHGYSGRGRVEFLKGNAHRARKAFIKAEELAMEEEARTLYRAKLHALSTYSQN